MTQQQLEGPYQVGYSDGSGIDPEGEGIWITDGHNGVALVKHWGTLADARLFAAAPEMLKALKLLEYAYLEGSDSEYGHAIIQMRAAILKAEGLS